ncbi:MAG: branched-chain amino acid aminotransferase [Acholeplasmatales bacterium]|nr:branched-chain amino acid aminotransferase [Acholeplasmatales bacterium]
MKIRYVENPNLKTKPNPNELGFGKYYTDHMFMVDWYENEGFVDPRIIPYGPIEFDPACLVLHYAQETFEGMKAYKAEDGRVLLFRPEMNAKRFITSNERLCMPPVPVEDFIQAVNDLVKKEADWIPNMPNTSLYIRPFMFAYQTKLGVHAANHYKFMVILSPVGTYYKEGLKPVSIYVEDELVRAVKGGTGFAKCGGNYASSILAQMKAEERGYSQVLWLDGIEHKYVEEVGTMNAMFVIDGKIVTAPLEGSVLPGVTRDSMIHLLKHKGYVVEERKLSIDELIDACKTGKMTEAFGTGTAAVISPIGKLAYKDEIFFETDKVGEISQMLYDTLTGIQTGKLPDEFGWTYEVK